MMHVLINLWIMPAGGAGALEMNIMCCKIFSKWSSKPQGKIWEMGIWKLPGFKSNLTLSFGAKELRAALLPTPLATQLENVERAWLGCGTLVGTEIRQRAERLFVWEPCKQGISSQVPESPTLPVACTFSPAISPINPQCGANIVKTPDSHLDVSKSPDALHQGREKPPYGRVNLSPSFQMFGCHSDPALALVPERLSSICHFKGLDSEVVFLRGLGIV